MKRFLFIALCGALLFNTLSAEAPSDSVRVYFKLGYRYYDPQFNGNAGVMNRFIDVVNDAQARDAIKSIAIRSIASPDGTNAANERLSVNRCAEVRKYVIENTKVNPDLVETHPGGIGWDALRRMVADDLRVPYQQEVLATLDNTPVWIFDANNKVIGGRKKALMDLRHGVPYRWLYENVFPMLRNAVAVSLYLKDDASDGQQAPAVADSSKTTGGKATDAGATDGTAESASVIAATPLTPAVQTADDGSGAAGSYAAATADELCEPLHRFALKTNIIYDALLMPSLELEWRMNDRWSLNLEGDVAWWRNKSKHKYYQLAQISPEIRRWFKTSRPWHGMYAGAFVGGTWYDLENGKTGYKGEGGYAGVSFGYMWPISRCFSLEAGLGAGYLFTRYKEYVPYDGHYLYQRTRNTHYFGPLKAKFAIVWRFNNINKKKGCAK